MTTRPDDSFVWRPTATVVRLHPSLRFHEHVKRLQAHMVTARECMAHLLLYRVLTAPYRPYRRGKARCPRCGLKTNVHAS